MWKCFPAMSAITWGKFESSSKPFPVVFHYSAVWRTLKYFPRRTDYTGWHVCQYMSQWLCEWLSLYLYVNKICKSCTSKYFNANIKLCTAFIAWQKLVPSWWHLEEAN